MKRFDDYAQPVNNSEKARLDFAGASVFAEIGALLADEEFLARAGFGENSPKITKFTDSDETVTLTGKSVMTFAAKPKLERLKETRDTIPPEYLPKFDALIDSQPTLNETEIAAFSILMLKDINRIKRESKQTCQQ